MLERAKTEWEGKNAEERAAFERETEKKMDAAVGPDARRF